MIVHGKKCVGKGQKKHTLTHNKIQATTTTKVTIETNNNLQSMQITLPDTKRLAYKLNYFLDGI